MKTKFTLVLLSLFTLFAFSSCRKAIDDHDVQYLGQWGSDKFSLEIRKNGTGSYQKKSQEAIECFVQIENNKIKFKSGATNLKTFDIDADPYPNQQGFTVMILDGNVFYRQ